MSAFIAGKLLKRVLAIHTLNNRKDVEELHNFAQLFRYVMGMKRLFVTAVVLCASLGIYWSVSTEHVPKDLVSICFQRSGISAEKSIAACHDVIEDSKQSIRARSEANFLLGYVYADNNNSEAALKFFDAALAIDPNKAIAAYNRALINMRDLRDAPSALADLTMVMKRLERGQEVREVLRGRLVEIYWHRFGLMVSMEMYDETLNELLRINRLFGRNGDPRFDAFDIISLFKHVNAESGKGHVGLDRIESESGQSHFGWAALSRVYLRLHNHKKAIAAMDRARANAPVRLDYTIQKAKLLLDNREPHSAMEVLLRLRDEIAPFEILERLKVLQAKYPEREALKVSADWEEARRFERDLAYYERLLVFYAQVSAALDRSQDAWIEFEKYSDQRSDTPERMAELHAAMTKSSAYGTENAP